MKESENGEMFGPGFVGILTPPNAELIGWNVGATKEEKNSSIEYAKRKKRKTIIDEKVSTVRNDENKNDEKVTSTSTSTTTADSNALGYNVLLEENTSHDTKFLAPGVTMKECETNCIEVTFHPSLMNASDEHDVVFIGRGKVRVSKGSLNIFGYQLKEQEKEIIVDSPKWMSHLTLSLSNSTEETTIVQISNWISTSTETKWTFHLSTRQNVRSAIQIPSSWNPMIQSILQTSTNLHSADVTYDAYGNIQQETSTTNNSISPKQNIILVCGGKGVGKSTCARYIINQLLYTHKKVALLDVDTGQPEMSVPGMISLSHISQPFTTPPHVHMITGNQKHIGAYYYGHVSCKSNPMLYTSMASKLLHLHHKNTPHIPLVMNTSGWIKGMGYEILSSLLDICNPKHVVQIVGSTRGKMFDLSNQEKSNRIIHTVPTFLNPTSSTQYLMPKSCFRTLRICTYFMGGYEALLTETTAEISSSGNASIADEANSIARYLALQKPYQVPVSSIKCYVPNQQDIASYGDEMECIYDILNGSIVGLCHSSSLSKNFKNHGFFITERDTNGLFIPKCFGLGIVRSIDLERKILYVLTPIVPENINVLVLGQIELPTECFFRGIQSVSFPYHTITSSTNTDDIIVGNEIMKSKNMVIRK